MFGFKRKPKHVHDWDTKGRAQYHSTWFGEETVFSVLCKTCGHTGQFTVDYFVFGNAEINRIARMAAQNGWLK